MSSIDDHGLRPVPERARAAAAAARAREPRPQPFTTYPDEVCLAIRMIQASRIDAEKPLSAANRQLLAQAMDVMAEFSDIQAQVDAAAD